MSLTQLPQFQGCAGRKAAEMLEFASTLRICGAKFLGFLGEIRRFFLNIDGHAWCSAGEQRAAPCLPA